MFANADGTRTLRAFQGRQFFRDGDGDWKRVDSSLVADGRAWRTKAEPEPKRFAAVADAEQLVSVELGGGRSFGFGLASANPVVGEVSDDAVTYPEVRTEADLHVQATPAGAMETIILKSVAAPTEWEFPLRLRGLTASMDEGSVVLTEVEGTGQATIPPGFMEDSNVDPLSGESVRSYGVTYELAGDRANPVLRVHADELGSRIRSACSR
ncbi:hypothetical protein [Qaidamihabitans albus]|uniref:hypothetical protein n=1 Tax=Qaidamihabitans albus TaxID=2795733 RepID=UPI0018F137A1|nr:hypothetical protein [Qaidamihabitans albus]